MGVMSRLIVLVHPRHTGPGFTSTSPALKRRDRRCRAGCASSVIEKREVGMGGVCSLRLSQCSLVYGLVGFECRHMAASHWTPREGPNSCPTRCRHVATFEPNQPRVFLASFFALLHISGEKSGGFGDFSRG